MIRDVAYGRLPKGRRVGLHVRFADWIAELPGRRRGVRRDPRLPPRAVVPARARGRPHRGAAAGRARRRRAAARGREGGAARGLARGPSLLHAGARSRRRRRPRATRGARASGAPTRSSGWASCGRPASELEAIVGESEALERDDLRCDGLIALGNVAGRQGRPRRGEPVAADRRGAGGAARGPPAHDPGRVRVGLVGRVFRRRGGRADREAGTDARARGGGTGSRACGSAVSFASACCSSTSRGSRTPRRCSRTAPIWRRSSARCATRLVPPTNSV